MIDTRDVMSTPLLIFYFNMSHANLRGSRQTCFWQKFSINIYFYIFTCLAICVVFLYNRTGENISINNHKVYFTMMSRKQQQNSIIAKSENSNKGTKKYILIWTSQLLAPLKFYGTGQQAFIANNCSYINCYVTANRSFFGNNISMFDALAFNGRNMLKRNINRTELPQTRSQHQKYIFFNMESADNDPICSDVLDGFFNWTATYRLDSDIPYPYMLIRDSNGRKVGPQRNMQWLEKMNDIDENIIRRLQNKTKAAAWFVSRCHSRSRRRTFVRKLQQALDKYGLKVDEYGACSSLKCPRNRDKDCFNMLENDYFFYLALENTLYEDYVTEKLLNAMKYYTIPIVFGGANYSRFLHPSSYLNAQGQSPEELAAIMYRLINSPDQYRQYFKWRNHYSYSDPTNKENVCAVCAALNNNTMVDTMTTYRNFRKYWHPNFVERCSQSIHT